MPELIACINQSLEELLDKMTFMFFDEGQEQPTASETPGEKPLITELHFDGCIEGSLNVVVSPRAAETITRNFMGMTPDEAVEGYLRDDGICEFTNILMGRTMILLNAKGAFHMDLPHLVAQVHPKEPEDQELSIVGSLDEDPFSLRLVYKGDPNAPAAVS